MADSLSDIRSRAEAIARTSKQDPQFDEQAPPRPSGASGTPSKALLAGTGRSDVTLHTDTKEEVRLEVDTHERSGGSAGSGGWPKDPEEWRRLLVKAAPWLAAGVVAIATGYGIAQDRKSKREDGEGLSHKARRKAERLADKAGKKWEETEDSAKRGWFGLKHRAEDTTETAGDNVRETGREARKKAEEAKSAVSRAADRASDKQATSGVKENYRRSKEEAKHLAGDATDSVKHAAHATKEAAHDAKEWAKDKGSDAVDVAARAGHAVEEGAFKTVAKGVAGAGAAQEATGKVLKEAGKHLEKEGHDTKKYYKGEVEQPPRRKWLGIF